MKCPECHSSDIERPRKGPRAWRHPVEKADRTWRVHKCKACGTTFVSVQTVLSSKDAAAWAEQFDPMIPPPNGSTTGPETTASPQQQSEDEPAS